MKEQADTPSHEWPFEPEFLARCDKVDDNEEDIHTHIDCEMDIKSDLCVYSFFGFLIILLIFYSASSLVVSVVSKISAFGFEARMGIKTPFEGVT